MTESGAHHPAADELLTINRELADLLRMNAADLALGADAALGDELVVCGILGGKDVGKSTLINALAQTPVSVDDVEVGRGTERPMAYVHEAAQSAVAQRLEELERQVGLDVTLHNADAIRNVVLVDLPDFDSEFEEHLRTVSTAAPLLDRVLWVQTPRKIGDRAWVEMFHRVIKDPNNVHCVLNKVDELLADEESFQMGDSAPDENGGRAETFWRCQDEWVAEFIAAAGCPQGDDHRFLVAAAFPETDGFARHISQRWDDPDWSRYQGDRKMVEEIARLAAQDLTRLRDSVLSPVSAAQAHAVKEANRQREQRFNVDRIRRHYDLDRTIEHLGQAGDVQYHQRVLNEAAGPDYCTAVAAGLRTRLRSDTELADELLERRVERWPLLRLVHWPFGWLSRALGRRISAASRARAPEVTDPLDVGGRSLGDRVALVRSRILADHAVVASRLGIDAELPSTKPLAARAGAAAARLVPQLETRLLDDIHRGDRRPSVLGKAGLWLILLWFPFLQPVLEGVLEMYVETGSWPIAHGLYRIVSAFSAVHLLAGFAVVAVVYVALLAGMYARALRAVRTRLGGDDGPENATLFAEAVDEVLITEILAPLARPFQDRLDRLCVLQEQLDRQAAGQ